MLFNALIQPHFDYICPAWYPNLIEKTKNKMKLCKVDLYSVDLNSKKCIMYLLLSLDW